MHAFPSQQLTESDRNSADSVSWLLLGLNWRSQYQSTRTWCAPIFHMLHAMQLFKSNYLVISYTLATTKRNKSRGRWWWRWWLWPVWFWWWWGWRWRSKKNLLGRPGGGTPSDGLYMNAPTKRGTDAPTFWWFIHNTGQSHKSMSKGTFFSKWHAKG